MRFANKEGFHVLMLTLEGLERLAWDRISEQAFNLLLDGRALLLLKLASLG